MDDSVVEARRVRSAALFNNSHFSEVVIAAADIARRPEDFVTTRKVAAAIGLADSLVRPVMLRLVSAGLLRRLPRLAGPRGEQHFAREGLAEWSALLDLARAISGREHPSDSPEATSRSSSAASHSRPATRG